VTKFLFSPHYRWISRTIICVLLVVYGGSALWLVPRLDALGFDEFDGFTVRYAIALILVQAGLQIVIVAGLIVTKHLRGLREAERARRMRVLEGLLSNPEQSAAVQEAARRWPDEFLAAIQSALQALSGACQERVAALLERSPQFERLLAQAGHKDPGHAIRAIGMIGRLRNDKAQATVQRALSHPAEAVRRAARKAIMIGGDGEARGMVLDSLCRLPFWERIILFHLAPDDDGLHKFLTEALASGRDDLILVALEFLLTRERLMPVAVPAALAQSPNLEVRIKFFRALPFLPVWGDGEDDPIELLGAGLRDTDWRVRAQAAKACGAVRAATLAPALIAMCGSFENPAEAGHAARALAALGGGAWNSLQNVAVQGEGAGSRIAAEVMERRLIGPEASA